MQCHKSLLFRIVRKHLINIFFVALLIILVGYEWRLLPETVIRSDGFIHMLQSEQARFWGLKSPVADISVGAYVAGAFISKLFGPVITSYLWFELGIILAVAVVFYLLVLVVTASPIVAFTASFIASVSYFGNWNMYGTHCYCFFLERVLNVPFVLLAFIFLHLYLTSKRMRLYVISLGLFFVGIAMGHVDILFTPAFLLYPMWWKRIFIGIPFGLATLFIVRIQPGFALPYTFLEFLLHPGKYNYFQAIALQLTYWLQYQNVFSNLSASDIFRDIGAQQAMHNFPNLFIVYAACFAIVYTRLPKYRALLATCITAALAMFFFNAYVKLPEIIVPNSNRYLYFPGFFLSIFWGIVLWYFFLKRNVILRFIGIGILIAYYYINVVLMNEIFKRNFEWGKSTKALYSYVLQDRKSLSPGTLVVVQWPEFWVQEAAFFTEQLGRGEVTYATEMTNASDWKTLVPRHNTVITLRYDSACDCVVEKKIK